MRSKKCLCGMLMFNLPDEFNGSTADALRLLADYMDETEGKQRVCKRGISGEESFEELTEMITLDLFNNPNIRLKSIGLHIAEFEDGSENGYA